jgi:cyanophycin synthetase
MPRLMRAALIAHGVDDSAIHIVEQEEDALNTLLGMADRDDLVLFFCENITRSWKQIIHFKPSFADTTERVVSAHHLQEQACDVPDGYKVISDARGLLIIPDAGQPN